MLDIALEIDPDKIIRRFLIKGHSGFKEKGKDIVCAGVSILVNTFDLSLNSLKEVKYKITDDSDYLFCMDGYEDAIKDKLRGLCLFLIMGLQAISNQYKNNVKLKIIKE